MNMSAKTIPTVLIVLLLWGGAVSCQSRPEASTEIAQSEGVVSADVNVAAFAALIDTSETGLLLDVRTDREFAMGVVQHKSIFIVMISRKSWLNWILMYRYTCIVGVGIVLDKLQR